MMFVDRRHRPAAPGGERGRQHEPDDRDRVQRPVDAVRQDDAGEHDGTGEREAVASGPGPTTDGIGQFDDPMMAVGHDEDGHEVPGTDEIDVCDRAVDERQGGHEDHEHLGEHQTALTEIITTLDVHEDGGVEPQQPQEDEHERTRAGHMPVHRMGELVGQHHRRGHEHEVVEEFEERDQLCRILLFEVRLTHLVMPLRSPMVVAARLPSTMYCPALNRARNVAA